MQRFLKALLEWPLALLMLAVSAPLLAVIAGVILATAGRPVLYRETRLGRHARKFRLIKFRTLTRADGPSVAPENDVRIFPAARYLRRWRLDELPQLINVLRGEMSLVGPRPLSEKHADRLGDEHRNRLLSVRPGITGPAALAFLADDAVLSECEDPEGVYLSTLLPAKVALELNYIEGWSLLLDARLLALTLIQLWSKAAREKSCERVARILSGQQAAGGQ